MLSLKSGQKWGRGAGEVLLQGRQVGEYLVVQLISLVLERAETTDQILVPNSKSCQSTAIRRGGGVLWNSPDVCTVE